MRASVCNATKMSVYETSKNKVKSLGLANEGIPLHFASASISGLMATFTLSPIDKVRTRLMNQPAHKKLYSGFVDCVTKMLKTEGPLGFYKGFLPIWG